MILTDQVIEDSRVHSDFLTQFAQTTGDKKLDFPKCKLSNRKFCKLVDNKQYFILPYVLFSENDQVESLLKEIQWCSDNFQGNFGVKYTIRKEFPSDRVVIAFENKEDRLLFLLRSDFGKGGQYD